MVVGDEKERNETSSSVETDEVPRIADVDLTAS